MGELATLLAAVSGLIGAVGGVVVGVLNVLATSRRERDQAARTAVDMTLEDTRQNARLEQLEKTWPQQWRTEE